MIKLCSVNSRTITELTKAMNMLSSFIVKELTSLTLIATVRMKSDKLGVCGRFQDRMK